MVSKIGIVDVFYKIRIGPSIIFSDWESEQSPNSPDFSMLDASIFPTLEKECNDKGAQTVAEIEAAVKAIWRKLNKEACEKAARRVEANMDKRSRA